MNYFEFHLGDYAEATQHLTFIEDAAYSRLLRKYYATEKALPCNVAAVARLVAARTDEERAAVETVLLEFFELREDGWHNKRCDEDIARYLAGEPERQARKSNEDARLKKHREERQRLFKCLNSAGEHLPYNARMSALRELHAATCNGSCNVSSNGTETPSATRTETLQQPLPATAHATLATATHSPVPNTQTPIPSNSEGEGALSHAGADASRETAKPKPKRKQTETPEPFDPATVPGLDVGAWNAWVAFRAERKPAIKPASMQAAAEQLAEYGQHQAAVVRHSKAQGYQGLFAPDAVKRARQQTAINSNPRPTAQTAEQLEDRAIADAIAAGRTDAEITAMPALEFAPNLTQRIRAQREGVAHAQH